MEYINIAKEFWYLIILISGGLAGLYKWRHAYKLRKNSSTELLYLELDLIKKQLIKKIVAEVKQTTTIVKQQSILEVLKNQCPECYNEVVLKLGYKIDFNEQDK